MPKTDPEQVAPRLSAGPASGDLSVRVSCLSSFFLVVVSSVVLFPGAMVLLTVPKSPAPGWAENLYRRTDAMLVSSEGEPRLVVVGGSGVLFGVRSDMLEAATGLRTINRGSHAGLSSRVIAARAKRHLQPGDKLLISMEYPAYGLDPPGVVPDMAWQQAAYFDLAMLGEWDIRSAASSLARASIEPTRAVFEWNSRFATLGPGGERYALGGLSRYGDGLWIPSRFERLSPVGFSTPAEPDRPAWGASIKELLDWARSQGIDAAIVPPAVLRPEGDLGPYTALGPALDRVAESHGSTVLAAADRHFFDDWQMADTHYHLTPGAAIENTWRLIESLEEIGWATLPEPSGRVVLGASSDSMLFASLLSTGIRPAFAHEGVTLEAGDLIDDASVLADAIEAGLSAEIVGYGDPAMLAGANDAVIAFGSAAGVDLDAVRAQLPDSIADRLGEGGGIAGVGRYADVRSIRNPDGGVSLNLIAPTAAGIELRHEFEVIEAAGRVSIVVNGTQMVTANRRFGFHAVVFDPSLGVVTATHTFDTDGVQVRHPLWRLSDGGAGVARREIGLDRLGARGARPSEIERVERGIRVMSTGPRSFAAVRFGAAELSPGVHWVEFVVEAPADAAIDACVFTPGNRHLARTPWSARVPTRGGQTRFVVPLDVDTDDWNPIQAGFCVDLQGMGVTVLSISLVSPVDPGDAPL